MTAQSSSDCSCPSSLLTREETPGSFLDADFLDIATCLAHPVTADDENSNTSETSLGHEFVACLTRLDQRMERIESLMSQLLEAMEDEDGDDEPRTYLDGKTIR